MSQPEPNSVVKVGSVEFSNSRKLSIIAGPCQLESREHAFDMAGALKEMAAKAGLGFVYKTSFDKANRTSTTGKRGLGLDKSLQIFADLRSQLGVPVLTDIHEREQCAIMAPVVDILQIPAFLSRQTDLLVAAAETGKVVNVKKGQFLAPWDMKNAIAKVVEAGNPNVLITERGASFGYNTLVVDMTGLPVMAKFGAPIVMDATHAVQKPGGQGDKSGGDREMAPYIARAAVAVGIAAVFFETHNDPEDAGRRGISDASNMLWLKDVPAMLDDLVEIDRIAKRPRVN
ncbi:MAG: 3-deoxy-8-phosphooctulonate synthase [Proteobacteria bacterium]|nr:3-deoxy-8-phosphooctulonate synthase [Pseudomonadota bacterium]